MEDRLVQMVRPELRPSMDFCMPKWLGCQKCDLCKTANRHVVFRGYVPAQVCFLGEAPGGSEDILGQPFVGPAGGVLDRIIDATRTKFPYSWCATNVVFCRPNQHLNKQLPPTLKSVEACRQNIATFLCLVQPKIVVLCGDVAQKHGRIFDSFSVFPPESKWPAWAIVPDGGPGGGDRAVYEALLDRPVYQKRWQPRYVNIRHPSYILRQGQPGDSQHEQEISSAILDINHAVKEVLV